ncbi:diphosphomevalonate/mevalonate 3,5-bisphosphate decarboxylase family protein [Mesonia aestuariivivens]|uniref:Diphosphomevalonate decarboxylase n=1 Tax=Mesonia aestuariivivens TaxID=2796128 RepID=A0ABS6VZF7_9FLAO|nr:diphosphomevalonate decarboxylase [Mesonia aestuariivivens]MBW2960981.1 diphosphomevalonate decarboxylase [Mesonia aestuariivivens]
MIIQEFVFNSAKERLSEGKVSWESPSNIALVKYWGKYGEQLPKNPSVSFTLNNCKTTTVLAYTAIEPTKDFSFEVFLDEEKAPSFEPKIKTFFERIEAYLPFLKEYHFTIKTSNSFPHSSGIASSASGMSALACCLMSIEQKLNSEISSTYFNQKASFLARLGSGSAARSIEGGLVVWGKHKNIDNSSDLYGTSYPYAIHEVFKTYQDTILLVDKGEKTVSSSVGHNLMHNHPYAEVRFQQAIDNLEKLKPIFKNGDLEAFINIVESEALTLHAMMMSSNPYFILMKPNTLEIINKVWKYRQETNAKLCFTLDAGANVHLLYPKNEETKVLDFIKNQLVAHCQNAQYICDNVGTGALQLA